MISGSISVSDRPKKVQMLASSVTSYKPPVTRDWRQCIKARENKQPGCQGVADHLFCPGNQVSFIITIAALVGIIFVSGEVAEWSNATVLKTVDRLRGPGVRIPPSPPYKINGLMLSPFILSGGVGGFDLNPMVRQIVRTDDLERANLSPDCSGSILVNRDIQRRLMIQFVPFIHCLKCAFGMGFAT